MLMSFNSLRRLRSARQTPTTNPGDTATNQRSLLQALSAKKAAPAVQGTQPGRVAATPAQRRAALANAQQARKAPAGAAIQGARQMSAQQAQAMKMANTRSPVQQALKAPAGAANLGARQMSAQQAQQLKASNTNRAKTGMAKGGMVKNKTKANSKPLTKKKGKK